MHQPVQPPPMQPYGAWPGFVPPPMYAMPPMPQPPPAMAPPSSEDLRTVFITGFPQDVKERELNNLMRFLPGYEASQMNWKNGQVGPCRPPHTTHSPSCNLPSHTHAIRCTAALRHTQAQGFALFTHGGAARSACDSLAGLKYAWHGMPSNQRGERGAPTHPHRGLCPTLHSALHCRRSAAPCPPRIDPRAPRFALPPCSFDENASLRVEMARKVCAGHGRRGSGAAAPAFGLPTCLPACLPY